MGEAMDKWWLHVVWTVHQWTQRQLAAGYRRQWQRWLTNAMKRQGLWKN